MTDTWSEINNIFLVKGLPKIILQVMINSENKYLAG